MKVWRDYEEFIAELTRHFPHEAAGIRKFYDECWRVQPVPPIVVLSRTVDNTDCPT